MKHIVFVAPDMKIGGVQQSLINLLRAFPRTGVSLSLLLFSKEGELLSEVPPGIEILEAAVPGKIDRLRRDISEILTRLKLNRLFMLIKNVYHRIGGSIPFNKMKLDGYDLAIAYNDGLATWFTAKRITAPKKIAFVHTDFRAADYNAESEREIYKQFETVCFSCQSSRESFLALLPEYETKTIIVPNTVDKDRIRALASEGERLPREKDCINLLTVGRLSREKGLSKVPELLRLLKEDGYKVRWYLVGDGPERDQLLSHAEKKGVSDELIFLGLKKNPYPIIDSCDVYVQPSDYEGYCIALAEARVLKRPILTCDFSGAQEQIKDGFTGFVTGFGIEDIMPKLKRLIVDKDLREQFSSNLSAENFSFERVIVLEWIERILVSGKSQVSSEKSEVMR